MKLYSTDDAAIEIGAGRSTVQRLCRDHAIGHRVGRFLSLTKADVRRLKSLFQGKSGNPNFVAGNTIGRKGGRPKKKSD